MRERLESIAEKLIGRSAYVLLSSDGAAFGTEHVGGLYGRRLDMQAREFLQGAGRWHGRRPAIFINDHPSAKDMELVATLVHELAHFADLGFDETPEHEVTSAGLNLARLIHWHSIERPIEAKPFCEMHSARFVRACVHFWRRLQLVGEWCPPDWLYEGSLYGAPDPVTVIRALGDEPDRLAQLPVSLVVDLPSPSEFDQLFSRS